MDRAAREVVTDVFAKVGSRTCYRDTWHPKKFGKRLKRLPKVEAFFKVLEKSGIKVRRSKSFPYFVPSSGSIYMPPLCQFKDIFAFYQTQFHEVVHFTGDDEFLKRQTLGAEADSPEACQEEVIAELGAMFFAQFFGYLDHVKVSSIAYINMWAKVGKFQDDDDLLRRLANRAYAAFSFILGMYNKEAARTK